MGQLRDDIKTELIRLLDQELDVDAANIQESQKIKDDLNLQSLAAINVFMGIEDKFDVEFDYEDLETISTVQEIIDYFEKAIAEMG